MYCVRPANPIVRSGICLVICFFWALPAHAQFIATTTLSLSICGNNLVDVNEECDVVGETGAYSTTIAGRQCDVDCTFGPYCGDGILQVSQGEECDDGNNTSGDFCAEDCTIELAGSGGGGGSSGGGTSSGGGSDDELGETQINVSGRAYPGETVHILLDTEEVGTVRADSDGYFDYAVDTTPGTVSMGFWALDADGNRSITLNNTFDVTQGAITNVNGVLLPPTLVTSDATINPGDTVTLSGQAIPDTTVEIHIDDSADVITTTADSDGLWSLDYTANRGAAEYALRARYVVGSSFLTTDSSFSTTLQLFVGVDGSPTTPSDLNRDGFINLIDFSILIFWWQTNGGNSDPPADINGNGNVGLEDFSILLFNWTG